MTSQTDFNASELSRRAAMLSAISYAAARLIGHSDWTAVVSDLLARLGQAAVVSRAIIFKLHPLPDGRPGQSCRFEWCAPGIPSIQERHQNEALTDLDPLRQSWLEQRQRGEVVQATLSDISGPLRNLLLHDGTQSLISVPIRVAGRLWGHITFDDCRSARAWSAVEVDVLRTAALLLAGIVERSWMDQALRDSEQRFRSIAEALPVIITKYSEGCVLYASPPAADMLGVTPAALNGRPVTDFYADPASRAPLLQRFHEQGGVLDDVEVTYRRADGSELPVTITTRRIVYDGSSALISAITDLTARKAADCEIARQREALHQADKLGALGSLLAGVAHELNNPLAVLVGQALMMEEELEHDPQLAARARRIRDAAERCGRIVRTFLAMARQRPAQRGAVRLAAVADAVFDLTAYSLRASGIQLERDLPAHLPALWGDQDQLCQLLLNLVINAQHALAETPGPRRLRVWARAAGAGLVLEVADSGPGVPEHLRLRVFEPFFTTKPVGMGTGIGLSLCHSIALAHGGRIDVTDAPEGGALFRVSLPLGQGTAEDTVSPPAMPATAPGKAVLIVDDEPEIADMLAEILEHAGYRTAIAHSGRQALERLAAAAFELVLSDIRMPDLDGPGLYQALAERWPALQRRVVFITGDILGSDAAQTLQQRIPMLEKPFKPDEVKRVVAELLAREDDD